MDHGQQQNQAQNQIPVEALLTRIGEQAVENRMLRMQVAQLSQKAEQLLHEDKENKKK